MLTAVLTTRPALHSSIQIHHDSTDRALQEQGGLVTHLEEGVDAGDAAVPRVLQIFQREPPVLRL